MHKEKILIGILLVILILAIGCSSNENITGGTTVNEQAIYEDVPQEQVEQQTQTEEAIEQTTGEGVGQAENPINETIIEEESQSEQEIETVYIEPEDYSFKFPPTSIVSTQHNISLSLDKIQHEVKNEYWGKITGITATVLNNGSQTFKPKLLVLLYDEKDFKEEWLKPKAEIEFDIEKLNIGEHITRDAIVNIAFDDIALTKHFKLVLVDAADPGNKPIVVVEKEFNPILG